MDHSKHNYKDIYKTVLQHMQNEMIKVPILFNALQTC